MMAILISLSQLLLLVSVLLLHTTALPILERSQEDVEGLTRRKINQINSLVARNYLEDFLDDRPRLQARQLGDIEFSNRYAKYLQTKAKLSSICAFLRRVQHVKKSPLSGDTENVNQLLKQFMCPIGYQRSPDL